MMGFAPNNAVDALARGTVAKFDQWVKDAQPGAQVIYGCGVAAASACPEGVKQRMMELAEAELVHLVQRRAAERGPGQFDYVAIRSSRPLPAGFPVLRPARVTTHNVVMPARDARMAKRQKAVADA